MECAINSAKHFPTGRAESHLLICQSLRFNTAQDELIVVCVHENRRGGDTAQKRNHRFGVGLATPAGLSLHLWTETGHAIGRTHDGRPPVCLPAYVSAQRRARRICLAGASGRLPHVNVAICGIYKLPRCPRTAPPPVCPVNIKSSCL